MDVVYDKEKLEIVGGAGDVIVTKVSDNLHFYQLIKNPSIGKIHAVDVKSYSVVETFDENVEIEIAELFLDEPVVDIILNKDVVLNIEV